MSHYIRLLRRVSWLALLGLISVGCGQSSDLLASDAAGAKAAGETVQPESKINALPTQDAALSPSAASTCPSAPPVSSQPYAQAATQIPEMMPAIALPNYLPPQAKASVHPTNFGDRFAQDFKGKPLTNKLLVVLHETVGPAMSTINTFQTPHFEDKDQVSYHAVITQNGTIVYLVPPAKRAFGAGNSVFQGPQGPETVKTKVDLAPSVNNFAYHISLETPPDGNNNLDGHSGYTEMQYQSLAWLVAKTKVPDERIVTHAEIDQGGDRKDPRSFDQAKFLATLHSVQEQAAATCPNPS